jgi:NAD(P)-dependent dehydrogenase (short-subunit alcohol dehydrogenase family)
MPSTLITGANRGLGLEFARQYLADGWQVYAACRDPGSASELRRLADASDHKLRIIALDGTDSMSVKALTEAFVDHVARSERKLVATLTSGMGSITDNTSGGAFAYRSSKAAVNRVMRSLAIDLAPRGISCVVVNPGCC